MRNLSDTGADKIEAWDDDDEYLSLKDYAGHVLVIQEAPVKRMGQYGEFATIRAEDIATGQIRTYASGAKRFTRQCKMLAQDWQGPVRCRVHVTVGGQYNNAVASLEDAPAAPAPVTKPIYSDLEQQARARVSELGDELKLSVKDKQELVRVHSDEMGKINWPAVLDAIGDIATKRRLALGPRVGDKPPSMTYVDEPEQQATAKASKKSAPVH